MKSAELYAQVRRAVYVEGISQREAARRFGFFSPAPFSNAKRACAGCTKNVAAKTSTLETRLRSEPNSNPRFHRHLNSDSCEKWFGGGPFPSLRLVDRRGGSFD
jgi:hypothetical protein